MTKPAPENDDGIRQVATIDYSVPRKGGGQEWHQLEVHLNDAFKKMLAEAAQPLVEAERAKVEHVLKVATELADAISTIKWNGNSASIPITIDGKPNKLGSYAIIPTHEFHDLRGQLRAILDLQKSTTTGEKT